MDSLAEGLLEVRYVATGAPVEAKRLFFTRLVDHLWGSHWKKEGVYKIYITLFADLKIITKPHSLSSNIKQQWRSISWHTVTQKHIFSVIKHFMNKEVNKIGYSRL